MQGRGKQEFPRNAHRPAAASGTIPTCENSGVARPGIEPGSPWREASKLTAEPPRPLESFTLVTGSCCVHRECTAVSKHQFALQHFTTPHRNDIQMDSMPHGSVKDSADVPERGNWASKTEFLLSCLGYAIGLGNVWRFPYLCYRNGGGAFLVPYLLMLFLCGIPLFLMETTLGQFSSRGCLTVFSISPLFKGAGYAIIVVNIICSSYYSVVVSYPLYFLAMCMRKKLPWEDCDNPWNTDMCLKVVVLLITAHSYNKILQISDGIGSPGKIVWQLFVCDVISWIILYLCIMNSVKSVGKVVYFTATFPFVIIVVLLARGLALPGALEGVLFYISPQWSQLANLKVWADAAIQIFYSLGPGWGGIINMASFNPFKNNLKRDSILVPILNCSTSILAGFVVFSVLGFMSHQTGVPIASVATGAFGSIKVS
ncbi:hypothetical protein PR048_008171 [Dryococelus australis]|uniref:Transporter n=1 Tax=Dryococelus australis TaxID=614101 RepID=A0ABQ9HWC1_9NEOP|nr:hypothetical protein PR048_008171 [Dryococelus australis]